MVTKVQRQKIGAGGLLLGGGAIAVFTWVIGGTNSVLYVALGLLVMVAGFAMYKQNNKWVSYTLLIAAVLTLILAIGRAVTYSATNGLAIVLFLLSLTAFYRGYQYFMAS